MAVKGQGILCQLLQQLQALSLPQFRKPAAWRCLASSNLHADCSANPALWLLQTNQQRIKTMQRRAMEDTLWAAGWTATCGPGVPAPCRWLQTGAAERRAFGACCSPRMRPGLCQCVFARPPCCRPTSLPGALHRSALALQLTVSRVGSQGRGMEYMLVVYAL